MKEFVKFNDHNYFHKVRFIHNIDLPSSIIDQDERGSYRQPVLKFFPPYAYLNCSSEILSAPKDIVNHIKYLHDEYCMNTINGVNKCSLISNICEIDTVIPPTDEFYGKDDCSWDMIQRMKDGLLYMLACNRLNTFVRTIEETNYLYSYFVVVKIVEDVYSSNYKHYLYSFCDTSTLMFFKDNIQKELEKMD